MSAPSPEQVGAVLKVCDALLETCARQDQPAFITLNALLSAYFNAARMAGFLGQVPGALRAAADMAELASGNHEAPPSRPLH